MAPDPLAEKMAELFALIGWGHRLWAVEGPSSAQAAVDPRSRVLGPRTLVVRANQQPQEVLLSRPARHSAYNEVCDSFLLAADAVAVAVEPVGITSRDPHWPVDIAGTVT